MMKIKGKVLIKEYIVEQYTDMYKSCYCDLIVKIFDMYVNIYITDNEHMYISSMNFINPVNSEEVLEIIELEYDFLYNFASEYTIIFLLDRLKLYKNLNYINQI